MTRHKVGCDKRFKEPKNQEPPHDWEPPAKIPKPINYASRVNPGASLLNRQHHQNTAILNQAARGALQVTILFNFILSGKILSGNHLDIKTSIIGLFYLLNQPLNSTVKLGDKKQISVTELFTDYKLFYTINLLLDKELLQI